MLDLHHYSPRMGNLAEKNYKKNKDTILRI